MLFEFRKSFQQYQIMFASTKITFAFSVTPCVKSWCSIRHPDTIFLSNFDIYLLIKCTIRLLEAQLLKSYRTFVIQKCYGGRAFLTHSKNKVNDKMVY